MAKTNDTVLFERLDTKHPDYVAWEPEWRRYRDVLGDALVDKTTYLPKNYIEPQKQYDFRMKVSEFIPESGLAIEGLIGALFNEKPKREFAGDQSLLKDFTNNADRKGKSWNGVVEDVAFNLLGYGTTRTLVSVPQAMIDGMPIPDSETTRAIEKAQKIRPFIINYTPLAVIDWEVSREGEVRMVRIKEESTVRTPNDKKQQHKKTVLFIEYDQEIVRWWKFIENDKGGYQLVGMPQENAHELGVVPMICECLREVKPMIGHSYIRYSSRADIQRLQAESDLSYDTYMHAHPLLAIWTEEALKDVGIGANSYLKLNPGSQGGVGREDARYINAPEGAFDALMKVIKAKQEQIYRQARVDPMSIASAGGKAIFQTSGAARAWSFGTSEARTLSKIADKMELVEAKVIDVVIRYQDKREARDGSDKLFSGDVQYPEEFDMASTSQLLMESSEIAGMINSPTLLRAIHKRIASSKVGDTTAKILKEIHDEIDKNPLINTAVGQSAQSQFQFPPTRVPAPNELVTKPPQGHGGGRVKGSGEAEPKDED